MERVQERVGRIQQLKEAVREEALKSQAATQKTNLGQEVMHCISLLISYCMLVQLTENMSCRLSEYPIKHMNEICVCV